MGDVMNEYADKMLVVNELPPPYIHCQRCKDIFFLKFTPDIILGNYIHDGTNVMVKTEPLYLRVLCKEWTVYFATSISISDKYNL